MKISLSQKTPTGELFLALLTETTKLKEAKIADTSTIKRHLRNIELLSSYLNKRYKVHH